MKEFLVFEGLNSNDKKIVIAALRKALRVFNRTFKLSHNIPVSTYNNFEKYCLAIGEKRQKWGVTKHKEGKIFLYNPSLWTKKETGHNPNDLEESLIHELFHVYCYCNRCDLPKWLEEGMATYLSQPTDGGPKDIDFKMLKQKYHHLPDLPNIDDDFGRHLDHSWSYLTAYSFIKYLTKNDSRDIIKKIIIKYKSKNKLFINHILKRWSNFRKEQNG